MLLMTSDRGPKIASAFAGAVGEIVALEPVVGRQADQAPARGRLRPGKLFGEAVVLHAIVPLAESGCRRIAAERAR
jgi:hypothetical protein